MEYISYAPKQTNFNGFILKEKSKNGKYNVFLQFTAENLKTKEVSIELFFI